MKKMFDIFRNRKYALIVIIIVAISLLLSGVLYISNPLATMLREFLSVESSLKPADVVLVDNLGGELNEAMRLFQDGYAEKILITAAVPNRYKHAKQAICEYHFIKEELILNGIPENKIYCLGSDPPNRLEKQRLFRKWVHENNIRSYILQPLDYHTGFIRSVHKATFPNDDVELIMHPTTGNFILRKEIIGFHNLILNWLYWNMNYAHQLNETSSNKIPNNQIDI